MEGSETVSELVGSLEGLFPVLLLSLLFVGGRACTEVNVFAKSKR